MAQSGVTSPADEEPGETESGQKPRYNPDGTPIIHAKTGILIDPRTGQVLWEKHSHFRRPMASLTKVMTALLILESGKLDQVVSASKNANETQYSSIYLAVGEKLTLRDLLWAILLRSANDACVAAAEFLDGSVPKFVAHMNRRAQELGLKDTHFVTPNGLHAPGHYSTAADLAKIVLEDMKYPVFNEMVRTKEHTIQRSIRKQNAVLFSRSRILWRWPLADGVKTGYTKQAGHCFIGSATYGGWRLLSVLLASPHVGEETRTLLEYGFRNYDSVKVATGGSALVSVPVRGGQANTVPLGVQNDLFAVERKGAKPEFRLTLDKAPGSVTAPVLPGQLLEKAVWRDPAGKPVAEADLVTMNGVQATPLTAAAHTVWWPLGALLLSFGAFKYAASAKAHRSRRRRLAQRSRRLDRSRSSPR
jgi:D-alanyl-D-alanine carboxypeptidase (penicillin-binding protein 5/6)